MSLLGSCETCGAPAVCSFGGDTLVCQICYDSAAEWSVAAVEDRAQDERLTRAHEAVREEMARFRATLPALLQGPHAGKWVVFLGGQVRSAHDNNDAAYRAGLDAFGRFGGHVIVKVQVEVPRYVSDRNRFGVP